MPRLARIRTGWRKERLSGQRVKKPITSNILAQFFRILDPKIPDLQTCRAILAFAKFGCLRVSEYTYGPTGFAPKISNVQFLPNFANAQVLIYNFNKSKTNQFGKKERIICNCQCPNPCAVHEMVNMFKFRPNLKLNDDLFMLETGGVPSASHINNMLHNLCRMCNLNPSWFTSHQLRSGGVTDYLAAGVPAVIVQSIARWACLDSMKPYKKLSTNNLVDILNVKKVHL